MLQRISFPVLLTCILGCGSAVSVVDAEEYAKIKNGMTYEEVVAIIGEEGSQNSSSTMPAVAGVTDELTTEIYSWQNFDGSNMNATFQNGALVMKAQFGL